jgi:hypothetical protein
MAKFSQDELMAQREDRASATREFDAARQATIDLSARLRAERLAREKSPPESAKRMPKKPRLRRGIGG